MLLSDPRLRSEDRGFFIMIGKVSQPEEETTTETATTEEKVETQPAIEEPAETKTETETTEAKVDPTPIVLNCPVCKGEGLQDERHLCPACLGTGKELH